jgi:hypothetical protein
VALGLIEGPRPHVVLRLMSHTGGPADFSMPSGYDPSALVEPFSELADDPGQVRLPARWLLHDGADVIKVCATGGVNSPSDQPEDEGLTCRGDRDVRGRDPPAPRPAGRRARTGDGGHQEALRGGVTCFDSRARCLQPATVTPAGRRRRTEAAPAPDTRGQPPLPPAARISRCQAVCTSAAIGE